MNYFFSFLLITSIFSQGIDCPAKNTIINRSIYNIGDTLSIEDQNVSFSVCNGANGYSNNDSFSFADLNGNVNQGEYKITIISMNATW